MDRGPRVTLGPKARAVEARADGREIFLRADGETIMEFRALGIKVLD